MNGNANDKDKVSTLILIRCHLHESFQIQYLQIKDLLALLKKLREQYDHIKTVILLQARYDW